MANSRHRKSSSGQSRKADLFKRVADELMAEGEMTPDQANDFLEAMAIGLTPETLKELVHPMLQQKNHPSG